MKHTGVFTLSSQVSVCAGADVMRMWASFLSGALTAPIYLGIHHIMIWIEGGFKFQWGRPPARTLLLPDATTQQTAVFTPPSCALLQRCSFDGLENVKQARGSENFKNKIPWNGTGFKTEKFWTLSLITSWNQRALDGRDISTYGRKTNKGRTSVVQPN